MRNQRLVCPCSPLECPYPLSAATRLTNIFALASIILTVTYPSKYPDEPPALNVTHPKDAPRPEHLSLPDDVPQLLSSLEETIQNSLGAAMILTLIWTLKDSAESLITSRIAALQQEADKEAAQAEERENAKFHGEAVTRESFLAWRQEFFEEQRAKEAEERRLEDESGTRGKKIVKEEKKLTGRELWERGLVGKIEEVDGDGDEEKDALAGVENLTVDD